MSVLTSTIHYILYGSQGKAMTVFSVNRAALFICAPPPSFLISNFSLLIREESGFPWYEGKSFAITDAVRGL